jgi:hypothetical protein
MYRKSTLSVAGILIVPAMAGLAITVALKTVGAVERIIFEPATCAQGFTANPPRYNDTVLTGQTYTCTGPAVVCSSRFTVQPLLVPVPPTTPDSFGTTISVAGVTIQNGRMVYTCAEPPTPPQ